jgi:hypothetical protein
MLSVIECTLVISWSVIRNLQLKIESKIITEVASNGGDGCSVVTTVARKVHHPSPFVDSFPHIVNIYVHARRVECNKSAINHTRNGITITFTQSWKMLLIDKNLKFIDFKN